MPSNPLGRQRTPPAPRHARAVRPEDVVEALHRAAAGRSSVYSPVRNVTQLILEDYLEPRGLREISWREILGETRAYCKGFYSARAHLGWGRFRWVSGVGCVGIVGIGRGVRRFEGGVHLACARARTSRVR